MGVSLDSFFPLPNVTTLKDLPFLLFSIDLAVLIGLRKMDG